MSRAKFYHADPELRICDAAGTRRRGRKRTSAGVTVAQVLDELDAELVSGGHSEEISVLRPDFPVDGWTCDTSKLPDNVSLGVILDHLRACGKSDLEKEQFLIIYKPALVAAHERIARHATSPTWRVFEIIIIRLTQK